MREIRNKIQTFFKSINRSIVAVLVLALGFTACIEDDWSPYKSNAAIYTTIVSAQPTAVYGLTAGDPAYLWVAQVVEGASFCSLKSASGSVGSNFVINFARNESSSERIAVINITFTDGYTNSFTIRQLGKSENGSYEHMWAEQPEYQEGASLLHKTYYTALSDGRKVRNFSICYDTDKICSRWVAYPAHSIYTSGRGYEVGGTTAGRTNAWAFDDAITQYKASSSWSSAYEIISNYRSDIDSYDTYTEPIIPQSKQADIRFNSGIGGGYARGHMLPSADRYNTWNTNAQTCYSTNIMAQDYDFNSASWGTLENKVRNKICADTLYVVVGTLFENDKTVSKNNRVISVPSHCFKLLLRTKKGNTKKHISDITSADELMCIGFIFENNATGAATQLGDAVISVAEIEKRSGFSFFRNLDSSIADEVKRQKDFSAWGF